VAEPSGNPWLSPRHRSAHGTNRYGAAEAGLFQSKKENIMEIIILVVVLVLLFGGGGGYYWSRRGR
jgi:hypothetical protein